MNSVFAVVLALCLAAAILIEVSSIQRGRKANRQVTMTDALCVLVPALALIAIFAVARWGSWRLSHESLVYLFLGWIGLNFPASRAIGKVRKGRADRQT